LTAAVEVVVLSVEKLMPAMIDLRVELENKKSLLKEKVVRVSKTGITIPVERLLILPKTCMKINKTTSILIEIYTPCVYIDYILLVINNYNIRIIPY
jgi:hypothetical protein